MATAAETREKYQQRKAAGDCVYCGKRPAWDGKLGCRKCVRLRNRVMQKVRTARATFGLCTSCLTREPEPNSKTCTPCREDRRDRWQALRAEVFAAYGGPVCVCCGENRIDCLQLDHVNNNGAEHRRDLGGNSGGRVWRWVKKMGYPPGYQVLCANCNLIKAKYGFIPDYTKEGVRC